MAGGNKRTGLIGAAGEYHVAAQLSQRGWLATITIKNSPGTDVLAQHAEKGVLVAIQTKTTEIASQGWILGSKDEAPTDRDDCWYVLVGMNGEANRPDFYVVPRNHVSAHLYVGHQKWLRTPGKDGKVHQDSGMRNIYPPEVHAYKEDWAALLEPTTARPYALPDSFVTYAAEVGLPDGHPDAVLFGATTLGT
ncbi:MAG: hypothetical protein KGL16_06855 [Acidobacteriota bacterium]|nr:hypothetical protein [Acidobacteriota bacterium]